MFVQNEDVELTVKPLLFLDIDGAVCPYKTPPGASVERIWGLPVPIVPGNRARLTTLASHFQVVWCSDWQDHSNLVGAAFGLPQLPHVPIPNPRLDQNLPSELPDPKGNHDSLWETHPLTFAEDFEDRQGAGSPTMFRKVPAVSDFLDEYRDTSMRFAWVDDHINYEARQFALDWPAPTLLIRTRRDVGLTDEIVDRLVHFARPTNDTTSLLSPT